MAQQKITSENDIVDVVRAEYGFTSGTVQEHVTVHTKGDSVAHIYAPQNKAQDVVDLLKGRNCRITRRCKRTRRNPEEVILEVMVGKSKSGDIYSGNFKEEEIYGGKPFRNI
jgi:hypothetical protein